MAAGLGRATGSRSATACCRNGRGRGLGHRQCVRDVVTARAEYVVALDYPRLVSLSRLVCRGLHRVVTKEPMCNGNYESWGRLLGKKSIIRWHFRSFDHKHAAIDAMEAAPEGPPVVRLHRVDRCVFVIERPEVPADDRLLPQKSTPGFVVAVAHRLLRHHAV